MKPYPNQGNSFEMNPDSNVIVLLIELKMMDTAIDNGLTCVDFLKADLLKQHGDMHIRVICNLPGENFSHERTNNITHLLNANKPNQHRKIAFPQRDGYEFIEPENILYCNAEGAYTLIHLTSNKKFLVSKALGCKEMLPAGIFIRIHHSYVVNVNAITNYNRTDGGYVIMNTGEKLIVSKARKDALLEKLGLKKD